MALLFICTACTRQTIDVGAEAEPAVAEVATPQTPKITELQIEDLNEGSGVAVKEGDTVTVEWAGFFMSGMIFDSSTMAGQPFEFTVGDGTALSCWDEGVRGMKVGGERSLTSPPEKAHGEKGIHSVIPHDVPLRFELKLIEIK
jgi:FKBP-type peptidyl-prolyl cis-trans isomerase